LVEIFGFVIHSFLTSFGDWGRKDMFLLASLLRTMEAASPRPCRTGSVRALFTATQRGFSLIEIMVTTGILAILAALAVPHYLAYANRAKMTEGIVQLSAAKTSITEFFANHSRFPYPEEISASLPKGALSSFVAGIEVEAAGINAAGAVSSSASEAPQGTPASTDGAPSAPLAQGQPPAHAPAHGLRGTAPGPAGASTVAAVTTDADAAIAASSAESALRIVARMNPDAFFGMQTDRNDRLMLEVQQLGGTLQWSCKPHPRHGVRAEWLPSSCRP
jgi:prepilin-type N-terminal cleavage/methylation domain-containing protein